MTHVENLTAHTVDAAARAARAIDHPVMLHVDRTHQLAVISPNGQMTVMDDRR